MNILIIDDSSAVRKYIREILQYHPDLVLAGEAGTLEDGLRLLIDAKPDVIILDVGLSAANGLVFLKAVKALKPAIKMIMLSNYADEPIRTEAAALGADHFLDKAFEFERLIEAIRQ